MFAKEIFANICKQPIYKINKTLMKLNIRKKQYKKWFHRSSPLQQALKSGRVILNFLRSQITAKMGIEDEQTLQETVTQITNRDMKLFTIIY